MSTSNGPLTDEDLLRAQQRQNAGIPNMLAGIPQVIPPQLTKPTNAQSHAAGIAEFNRGIPQVTAQPGTPEFYQQKMSGIEYQKAHPFGSDISAHPGVGGKILHGLATIGNIAGDVIDPAATALIPNSNLNRALKEKALSDDFHKAQQEETQKEAVEQRPDIAEEQGELKQQLEDQKEQEARDLAAGRNKTAEDIATGRNKTAEDVAAQKISSGGGKVPPHITAMGADGKPHIMERDPQSGEYSVDRGVAPQNYGELVLPTKTATFIDPRTNVPTEFQWNPQTQAYDKPLGVSASGGYGHEAAQAGAVQRAGTDLIDEINQNRNKLGNVSSIINSAFLGTPLSDPTSQGLAARLASFAALNPAMHGARGLQAIEAFERIVGGIPNNPDALIAAIQAISKTAGAINPSLGGENAPPAGAKIISLPDFLKTK